MVVVALLSVDLVESVDVVSVYLVVNCTYIYTLLTIWASVTGRVFTFLQMMNCLI